jgi:hypothetical protein
MDATDPDLVASLPTRLYEASLYMPPLNRSNLEYDLNESGGQEPFRGWALTQWMLPKTSLSGRSHICSNFVRN